MKAGTFTIEVNARPEHAFERLRAWVINAGFPHEAEYPSRVVFTTGDGGATMAHEIRIEPSGGGSRFVYTPEHSNVHGFYESLGAWTVAKTFNKRRYRGFLQELKAAAESNA